ncbi:nuclear envelope integral membrane protein 2 isoform X2 [Eleutherodactylus coqui]|uniref:nuclear envelope integral membrane protein 2 isoform X2 n=1 Tax=Eleutherodactylus coqui TaxID=57060 RepID=UPI003462820B
MESAHAVVGAAGSCPNYRKGFRFNSAELQSTRRCAHVCFLLAAPRLETRRLHRCQSTRRRLLLSRKQQRRTNSLQCNSRDDVSSIFFYAAGAMLGMAASVLFLVIVLKRFISKPNTLWLLISLCCFLTAYVGQFLNQHMAWIWAEKKPYVIGYLVTLALISFSACYSHGPLRSEFSFSLFTWTLQTIACFLIYFGHPVNEIAFAVIAVLLSSKGLPRFFRAIRYIYSKVRRKKPIFGFLTEEEYNEQCELETLKALKDLRDFCSSPDFNSWLTVSRLSSPKRFAEFVLGSSHVSCEEVTAHEQQYGLGSLFMEDLIVQDREVEHNLQVTVGQNENDYTEDLEMDQHSA